MQNEEFVRQKIKKRVQELWREQKIKKMNGMKQLLWKSGNIYMIMEKFKSMTIHTNMKEPMSIWTKREHRMVILMHMKTEKATRMGQCTAMSTARRRKRQS